MSKKELTNKAYNSITERIETGYGKEAAAFYSKYRFSIKCPTCEAIMEKAFSHKGVNRILHTVRYKCGSLLDMRVRNVYRMTKKCKESRINSLVIPEEFLGEVEFKI